MTRFVTISGRSTGIIPAKLKHTGATRRLLGGTAPASSGAIDEPSSRHADVKAPTATRLAWSLGAVCVATTIGGIVLADLNGHLHLSLIHI